MDYSPPPAVGSLAGPRSRLGLLERLLLAVFGVGLLATLMTAWRLTPEERGHGTHQQLGLAPCSAIQWFGLRCPSCGMTTAWAHATRGQVLAAARANAGGALLALAAATAGPWLLASGLLGRWVVARPSEMWLMGAAIAVCLVTLAQWAVRVSFGW